VLRRADVVLGDVQENGGIKMRVSDSLVFERLGGYFHHHMGKACIYGIAHMTAQLQGFRRGER